MSAPRPPLTPSPSRVKLLVAGPLAAVAVLGLGAAGVARLPAGSGPAVLAGEGLRIEVVQPPAPAIDPGSRMDVGELVDGYRHVAYRRAEPQGLDVLYADAWLEQLPPLPEPARLHRDPPPERYDPEVRPTSPQPSMDERPRPTNPYGFDAPSRDYAAERRARREHMARLEDRRAEARTYREERGVWRPVPPYAPPSRLDRDVAFY